MAKNLKRRLTVLVVIALVVVTLQGCAKPQFVSEPYPRWGKEYLVSTDVDSESVSAESLTVRVLFPPEDTQPAACLLLVHGMNEHIGRYHEVANYFSRQFVVAGFDYYAHGLSNPVHEQADVALRAGNEKQDVKEAFLAQVALSDLEPMRRDLDRALRKTQQICHAKNGAEKPLFIVAHSLGALIAASYLLQQADDENSPATWVSGVVFLGPGFAVSQVPGWRGWLTNPLIKLSFHAETHFLNPHGTPLPVMLLNQLVSLVTVPILDGLFEVLSWPGIRRFTTPSAPDWVLDYLTDSEIEKTRLQADGWIIRRSLLRYVKGIEQEIVQLRRDMEGFSLPYYLIYSAHDPITPAWGSDDFIAATLPHHPDNQYQRLVELRYHQHLFLSQPLRTTLLNDIEQWLMQRIDTLSESEE